MAKTAQLADGTTLEFPDETSDAVMDAAVRKHTQEQRVQAVMAPGAEEARRKQAIKETGAEMSLPQRALAGSGAGFRTIAKAVLPQALEKRLGIEESVDETMEGLGTAGKVARFGTEVGATMLPAAKAAQLAGRGLGLAGRALTPVGAAAIEGMTAGALTSPEDQGKGVVAGGLGGAAGQRILSAILGRAGKPVPQLPGAERARREGIEVSAGQGADPSTLAGRTWGALEEGFAGIPVLGQALARRRGRGQETWREKAIEKALPEGGPVPKGAEGTTEEAIEGVRKQFTNLYEDALRGKKISIDEPFEEFVTKAINDPARYMTQAQREYVESLLQKHVYSQVRNPPPAAGTVLPQATATARALPPPPAGTAVGPVRAEVGPRAAPPIRDIAGEAMPAAAGAPFIEGPRLFKGQSELLQLAHKLRGGRPSEEETGKLMGDIADEVYRMIGRQDKPAGAMIEKLREPYSKFSAVERAGEKAGGGGAFTPRQLRQTAKAQPELQEFAKLGEQFVQRAQPPGRGTWPAYAALAGGYMLGGPAATAAGAAMIPVLGTKLAQRALRGDYAAQKALIKLLRKQPTLGAVPGGVAGANISE